VSTGGRLAALTLAALTLTVGVAGVACSSSAGDAARAGDEELGRAFDERARDLQVEGAGKVARVLEDDVEGGRHQRFIVRLTSGQTLLIAHNIDVAPRVEDLRVGDTVEFRGVYEWSEKGGTVHWTHHDPDGAHAPGWLRHEGQTYE
jgi:ABC-type glycerol-3-phosphate transport system substrate-binding protein